MRDKFYSWLVLILITVILLPSFPVFAETYIGTITVIITNNGTTSYTYMPVLVPMNNTGLNSLGYISSSGLNTNMTEGSTQRQWGVANVYTPTYAFNIPSSSSLTYTYKLGSVPGVASTKLIVGNNGSVATSDSGTLEPGANFNLTISGLVDTSSNKVGYNLTDKGDALRLWVPSANRLRFTQSRADVLIQDLGGSPVNNQALSGYTYAFGQSILTSFNATLDWLGLPLKRLGTDPKGNVTIEFYRNNLPTSATRLLSYNIDSSTLPTADFSPYTYIPLNSLSLNTTHSFYCWAVFYPGGDPSGNTTSVDGISTGSVIDGQQLTKATGSMYSGWSADSIARERRYRLQGSAYIEGGVTPGDHLIEISSDGTTTRLRVDSVQASSMSAVSIYNNGYYWSWMENNTLPYVTYIELKVGGAQRLLYQPVSIYSSTNLPDRSGNGNTGTIYWGTNPPNLSVSYGSIGPGTGSVAPPGTLPPGAPGTVPGVGTGVGVPVIIRPPLGLTLFEDPAATGAGLPVYDLMVRFAGSMGWSVTTSYGVFMFLAAIAMGFAVLVAGGGILGGLLMMTIMLGAAASTLIFPFWIALIVGIGGVLGWVVLKFIGGLR